MWKLWLIGAGGLLYPLAVQESIRLGRPDWALALLGACYAGALALWLGRGGWRNPMHVLGAVALAGLPVLMGLLLGDAARSLLFVPPVLVNLALAAFFLQSLGSPAGAVITRIARLLRQRELSPEQVLYTRRVTWLWAVLFAGLALESGLLALFAPLAIWSLFTNGLNYGFIMLLFLLEYRYRRRRFPALEHDSFWRFVGKLAAAFHGSGKRP